MKQQISIAFPESLAFSLKMDKHEFQSEMKIITLVKLYELGKYKVSYFPAGMENELESDFRNA